MQLFQYAILYQEPHTKEQKDAGVSPKTVLLKEVTSLIAKDANEAQMRVAREIPAEYLDKLDRVTIVIRPF